MLRTLCSLLLAAPVLIGCASQPAPAKDQHAYSDEEVKAFALKALSSSNMSSDLYSRYRRALSESHPRSNDS